MPPAISDSEASRRIQVRELENSATQAKSDTVALSDIALRNQQESPLLKVPAEIRNIIYDYVLGGRAFNIWSDITLLHVNHSFKQTHAHALLQVSRQVHQETAHLPYTLNDFTFSSVYQLEKWTQDVHLSTFLGKISHIRYRILYFNQGNFSGDRCTVWTSFHDDKKERWSFKALSNLRSIHMFVEVHDLAFDGGVVSEEDHEAFLASATRSQRKMKDIVQTANPGVTVTIQEQIVA